MLGLLNSISLYKICYGGIVVFSLLIHNHRLRYWHYLLTYFIIISFEVNPLIVSRWQVLLANFAIIVIHSLIQTRSLDQAIIWTAQTYLNLQFVDQGYLFLIHLLSFKRLFFYPVFLILACLVLWFLKLIEERLLDQLLSRKPHWKQATVLFHFILCLLLLVPPVYQTLVELTGEDASLKQFVLIINLTIFGLFLLGIGIVYYGLKQIQTAERTMAQAKINQEYSKMMETQYTEVRKFRHDYKNVLLSLEGLIKDKDWSSLEHYFFSELSQESHSMNTDIIALERLVYIPNAEIRNIFYTKLSYAIAHQIQLNVEIDEHLPKLDQHLMALSRMLGIILDNAIEESQKYTQGQIDVLLTLMDQDLLIAVSNYTQARVQDLVHMNELGYSTKGTNRGFGLANLKEIANQAKFELYTDIDQDKFIQEIYIPINN